MASAPVARVWAIRDDERRVLTVSSLTLEVEGVAEVTLSLPRVIGRVGVVTQLSPSLSGEEHEALARSAGLLKQAAMELGF